MLYFSNVLVPNALMYLTFSSIGLHDETRKWHSSSFNRGKRTSQLGRMNHILPLSMSVMIISF